MRWAGMVTTRPEATIPEAVRVIHAYGVKRLPVVDGDGRGVVCRGGPSASRLPVMS